ncbi:MAG: glycosyl hydrolase 53 family protein [bacterium]
MRTVQRFTVTVNPYPLYLTLSFLTLLFIFNATPSLKGQEYMIGADLSFLKMAEDRGMVFKEEGVPKKGLQIFHDHGYNWIRLRLFHTPTQLPNDLAYTLQLAKEAKAMGYKFLLDFHYSDTWADPAKQYLPKAWEGLSHDVLVDSVFQYTKRTIITFREAGVMPDMVQNGNEIINGMLWPDGKLPDRWDNLAELIQAGINGVHAGCGKEKVPLIMIHIDQGANKERTKYFFDRIVSYGISYDVIGQSYYPWWHGSLLDLRDNLYFMAKAYRKPIVMVEVAYCSEPTEYEEKQAPFPESPEGQRQFLENVHRMVMDTPDNLGRGVFWWEPAVGDMRGIATRDIFDNGGNVLPVIGVFDKFTRY